MKSNPNFFYNRSNSINEIGHNRSHLPPFNEHGGGVHRVSASRRAGQQRKQDRQMTGAGHQGQRGEQVGADPLSRSWIRHGVPLVSGHAAAGTATPGLEKAASVWS